jgi:hypothetical protein
MGDQSSAKASTYTGQHNTEKHRHTSMPRAGFEPEISTFERPKTVLALDRAATETGHFQIHPEKYWCHHATHLRSTSKCKNLKWSRDSSVSMAGWSGFGGSIFLSYNRVQTGSGAHPASYPMGTWGSFPGGKTAGAWSCPLTPI